MFDIEFGSVQPGYNTAGLDRGSHFPLSDLEGQYAHDFVAVVDKISSGEPTSVTIHQRDAFSPRDENIRDEIVDKLGHLFQFDVDGMLSRSEYESAIMVAPEDKERLSLLNPAEPLPADAIIRHLRFGNVATKANVSLFEIEFQAPALDTDNSVHDRIVRIITCMSEHA